MHAHKFTLKINPHELPAFRVLQEPPRFEIIFSPPIVTLLQDSNWTAKWHVLSNLLYRSITRMQAVELSRLLQLKLGSSVQSDSDWFQELFLMSVTSLSESVSTHCNMKYWDHDQTSNFPEATQLIVSSILSSRSFIKKDWAELSSAFQLIGVSVQNNLG